MFCSHSALFVKKSYLLDYTRKEVENSIHLKQTFSSKDAESFIKININPNFSSVQMQTIMNYKCCHIHRLNSECFVNRIFSFSSETTPYLIASSDSKNKLHLIINKTFCCTNLVCVTVFTTYCHTLDAQHTLKAHFFITVAKEWIKIALCLGFLSYFKKCLGFTSEHLQKWFFDPEHVVQIQTFPEWKATQNQTIQLF